MQYKILLTAVAASLRQQGQQQLSVAAAAAALREGAAAVSKYGGAQQGSRTMLDALIPAAEVGRVACELTSSLFAVLCFCLPRFWQAGFSSQTY